ncbi:TetR family transcriptional regulator [Qingshengfaniella alkalisoli]|uniref:TetR/AcrR family transcriptional regulator n=1 Tax=Qingshengfaniella alkalisoli TaxID=2599296 RepID=A0A5B8JBQ9_9RHOB|nr:TetR family transcriptional regulator [Qingshengfaniella alkalisoli]QDY71540.1 TetR/AcrR family transcriptional regulator [Qingshengfaniella alkalisoli]
MNIKAKPAKALQRVRKKRDAEGSKKAILEAALIEFSEFGHAGARVDRIAKNAGVSKPLIYDYFGDKEAIYAAALKEAYIQIREGEGELNLDQLNPPDAIRALVHFTMDHFRLKPWFISMLNTENLRGGDTIRELRGADEIQSVLVEKLRSVLARGAENGQFRSRVDPVELYIFIASLCYFPVSNKHTLRAVFKCPVDDAWLERRADEAADMLIRYLAPA